MLYLLDFQVIITGVAGWFEVRQFLHAKNGVSKVMIVSSVSEAAEVTTIMASPTVKPTDTIPAFRADKAINPDDATREPRRKPGEHARANP